MQNTEKERAREIACVCVFEFVFCCKRLDKNVLKSIWKWGKVYVIVWEYIHVQMFFYLEEILMTIAIAINIICVQPKMENIPDGDWYCYECVSKVSNSSSSTCIHIGLMTTVWNGLTTTMWNSWFDDHNVKQMVCWPQCETAGLLTTMWKVRMISLQKGNFII